MITRYHKSKCDWRLERWLKFVRSSCTRTKTHDSTSVKNLDFLPRINPHRWSYHWYDHYYNNHLDDENDGHADDSEHCREYIAHDHDIAEHRYSGDGLPFENLEHTTHGQGFQDKQDSDHPYRESIHKSHFPTAEQDFDEITIERPTSDQLPIDNLIPKHIGCGHTGDTSRSSIKRTIPYRATNLCLRVLTLVLPCHLNCG